MFSLFWMLARKKFPSEVTGDITNWLHNSSVPRMNKDVLLGLAEESDFGEIELDIAGNLFNFPDAELAPLTGAVSANYARSVFYFSL